MDIHISDISKSYGKTVVFDHFSLDIKENQITCIMGQSGIGKTTLIHILLGLEKVDSGNIIGIEGKKITAVFQENRLLESMDSIKNIQLVCKDKVSKELIVKALNKVGLEGYESRPVKELSGGMKQRVSIVRALLPKSDLIIMDEPFKGLDEERKKKVIEYVKESTLGKTVIIVTHNKEEIEMLNAERIDLSPMTVMRNKQ